MAVQFFDASPGEGFPQSSIDIRPFAEARRSVWKKPLGCDVSSQRRKGAQKFIEVFSVFFQQGFRTSATSLADFIVQRRES
jgi:hypothetical protein